MDMYHARKRQWGGGFSRVIRIGSGDTAAVLFAAQQPVDTGDPSTVALFTIHVQRIEMVVFVGAGGAAWTVGSITGEARDLTGAKSATTSNTRYSYDFGAEGVAIPEDNDLEFLGVAGATGYIMVEGFASRRTIEPEITVVDPDTGVIAGGESVNIDVWPNEVGSRVFFGTAEATVVSYGDYFITVTTPAHAAGLVDVTVLAPTLPRPIVLEDAFTFA
jgi:hypothetical protein